MGGGGGSGESGPRGPPSWGEGGPPGPPSWGERSVHGVGGSAGSRPPPLGTSPSPPRIGGPGGPSPRLPDRLDRRRVLQGGDVAEWQAEVPGADDPAHHLGV